MTTSSRLGSRRFGFWLARPILWATLIVSIVILSSLDIAFAADTPVATVPVGTGPAVVAVDPLSHHAFIGNYYVDSVSVIDGVARSSVATIAMPTGGAIAVPVAAVVDVLIGKAYVGNFWSNYVSVVDGGPSVSWRRSRCRHRTRAVPERSRQTHPGSPRRCMRPYSARTS